MKDLSNAKHILGMEILRDRKADKLWLSQEIYRTDAINFQYEKFKASFYTTCWIFQAK